MPPRLLNSSLEYANASSNNPYCDLSCNLFISPLCDKYENKDCAAFLYAIVLPDSDDVSIVSNSWDRASSIVALSCFLKSFNISPPVTNYLPLLYLVSKG